MIDSTDSPKPELTSLAIRMPVEVYSGIAPPQALLDQMANRPTAQPTPNFNRPPGSTNGPSFSGPTGQVPSDHIEPSPSDIPLDAPPSYEDAMADDLAPIDGSRREYTTAPSSRGEKSANNDRLFPESGR